jgi:hypothetical protein
VSGGQTMPIRKTTEDIDHDRKQEEKKVLALLMGENK